MKKIFFVYCLLLVNICYAQNVGIGTNTPGFPLSFPNTLGDKISLYGSTGNHYGFGVQGGLFQIHSDAAGANIAFGYGSSAAFTERMRIVNSGEYGMQLNGRILLRNGTLPINNGYGPGLWLTKPDNTATLGFIGVQNNQNMGFYGGPAGWGLTYDAVNSRVGIGNQTPNAPLAFPAALGKKITLYPGALGNVGLGVYANELRIHTDYEPADITFGYENNAGIFTERMRIKGNGALSVNGNTGQPGEVLQSNGNAAANWVSGTNQLFNNMYQFDLPTSHTLGGVWTSAYYFNNLSQTINLTKTSKVLISMNWAARSENVIGDINASFYLCVDQDYPYFTLFEHIVLAPGKSGRGNTGFRMLTLPPGNHTFKMCVLNSGAFFYYGADYNGIGNSMNIIVVPQ
jgi:hypothetical protein